MLFNHNEILTKEQILIRSEKLWNRVLTFDTYRTCWKCLKKTWESYLLLGYGLPEWDFDKQIHFFSKNQ